MCNLQTKNNNEICNPYFLVKKIKNVILQTKVKYKILKQIQQAKLV